MSLQTKYLRPPPPVGGVLPHGPSRRRDMELSPFSACPHLHSLRPHPEFARILPNQPARSANDHRTRDNPNPKRILGVTPMESRSWRIPRSPTQTNQITSPQDPTRGRVGLYMGRSPEAEQTNLPDGITAVRQADLADRDRGKMTTPEFTSQRRCDTWRPRCR
jgi:hypothetical protein